MQKRRYNFSPGPAMLPLEVISAVREALENYNSSGIGIMELSHRTPAFAEIIDESKQLLKSLLQIPNSHEVLFTTGGATQQFSMIPMNLLRENETANYLISGHWANLAYEEAKKFGKTHLTGTSKEQGFSCLPKTINISETPAYLHYTSNNTIYGTQFKQIPETTCPLVCDASSDILTRPMAIEKHGLIYAGTQKTIGTSGATLVIIEKSLLERSSPQLPVLMNYNSYAKYNSLYNTPPALSIFVLQQMLRWINKTGGAKTMLERCKIRAGLIYGLIDSCPLYQGTADTNARSLVNITFRLNPTELEAKFIKEAEAAGFSCLEGHRNLGGVRLSMYNGFPIEGAKAFAQFMEDFAEKLPG